MKLLKSLKRKIQRSSKTWNDGKSKKTSVNKDKIDFKEDFDANESFWKMSILDWQKFDNFV